MIPFIGWWILRLKGLGVPMLVNLIGFVVDTEKLVLTDVFGKVLSTKTRFSFPCVSCTHMYETLIARERKKKNKWHCQSCAISCEWKNASYRTKHVEQIVAAKSTAESKARHSTAQKLKYADPEFRERTTASLRRVWASAPYRAKISASLRKRWATDPPKCISRKYEIQTDEGQIVVKSTYERNFVRYLDALGLKWTYEPRSFVLKTLGGRVLIPDFYVKDLDLVVEIKGYFWHDAKEKWDAFMCEYPDVNKLILFKSDLQKLITGERTLEDCLSEACW